MKSSSLSLGDAADGDVDDASARARTRTPCKHELTRRSHASSSRRCSSTRPSRIRSRSPRSWSPAAPRACPGFVEELERLVRARVRVGRPAAAAGRRVARGLTRDDLRPLAVAIGLGVER